MNRVPLTTFHVFSELPTELRLLIWGYAARSSPRLLELRWKYKATHRGFEIAPKSRRAPGFMHACHEARKEGKRAYEERVFCCYDSRQIESKIWYNPDMDILFFGAYTCMSTVERFFAGRPDISRVAFLCKGQIQGCCSKIEDLLPINPTENAMDINANVMQILHGGSEKMNLDRRKALRNEFPGAPNIKDVYFVIKTELLGLAWFEYPYRNGSGREIDANTTLCHTTHEGITPAQIALKRRLDKEIENIHKGHGVPGTECNRWVKDFPEFHFMTVANLPEDVSP